MSTLSPFKLLILFAVSFSLVSISGPLASYTGLFPHVNLARANPAPATSWIPAGPAMDTEKANIFSPQGGQICGELCSLEHQSLDMADLPLGQTDVDCLQNGVGCPPGVNPAQFSVTSPISEHGYYELEFDLSNNFWGVPFNFGSDTGCIAGSVSYSLTLSDPRTASTAGLTTPCPGVSIRQGIAHLLDKNIFAASATMCASRCISVDNPVPPSDGLPTPNACGWDTLFPSTLEVGPCEVGPVPGTGQAGGISYHFAAATPCGVPSGCASTPVSDWEPGLGTPDFCAAADHFIAAGLATGKDPNTCALTGIAAGVTAHTVNVYARLGPPREELGTGLADAICALFTGQYQHVASVPGTSLPCQQEPSTVGTGGCPSPGCYVTLTYGNSGGFVGYTTSSSSKILSLWGIYTGASVNVFPFDSTLFGSFNSRFVSNNGSNTGTFGVGNIPPCSSASVPTNSATNYLYNCVPLYDQLSGAMEFANCISSPNPSAAPEPTAGRVNPTFATCTGTLSTGLCTATTNCTATSAGYQSENLFGQQVVTIPVFAQKDQFAYRSVMANVINSLGIGIPQFFTWLNTYTNNPAAPGISTYSCPTAPTVIGPDCFRQGFNDNTFSINPYDASLPWDFDIIGNIYDSLLRENPMDNGQLYGYMTTGFPTQLSNSQLGYTPAAGTTVSYRFTLRGDQSWQDGAALTSWDVKFSYITLKATGAFQATGLSQLVDVHVLNTSVFDINLSSVGPFTLFTLGAATVIPGRHWSAGGLAAWDSAVNSCANSRSPDSCFTAADPGANSVTATISSPTYDPMANGVLIGSGPLQCLNPTTGFVGGGCSSTSAMNPGAGGFYQLTRYGAGTSPGVAVPSSKYFRSSGTLAVYVWTGNNGQSTHDFTDSSTVTFCYNKAVGTAGCTQWQQGIGNPCPTPGCVVGFQQVSAVTSFQGVRWTDPFNWLPGISYACCPFTPNPPTGIAPLPLTLFEGISTGNSGNPFASGTAQVLQPATVAGCTAAYPTGGYDC